MNRSKHCKICENQITEMKTGTKCGLTGEKPQFNKKCEKISFDKKYKIEILNTNIDYESIRREKIKTYSKAVVIFFGGIAVMLIGIFLGLFAFESGVISTVPLIIIGVGFLTLPKALHLFVSLKQELSVAKAKKSEMDSLLFLYNIEYDLKLRFIEDIHGNIDIEPNLTFIKKQHYK